MEIITPANLKSLLYSLFNTTPTWRNTFRLPAISVQELFDECQRRLRKLYGVNGVCSKTYFYEVWKTHRPQLKPKTGGDFMKCSQCTLYSATLLGSPGVRVTADDDLIQRTTEDRKRHLEVWSCLRCQWNTERSVCYLPSPLPNTHTKNDPKAVCTSTHSSFWYYF